MLESAEMPSAQASRENLKRWRASQPNLRTYSQSLMLKVAIWDWHKWHSEERKQYPTQRALARALGVNQS